MEGLSYNLLYMCTARQVRTLTVAKFIVPYQGIKSTMTYMVVGRARQPMQPVAFFSLFSLNFRFASIFSLYFRLFYLRFRFRFLVFRIEVNHVKSGFFFASKRNEIFASISNFASEAKVRAHPTLDYQPIVNHISDPLFPASHSQLSQPAISELLRALIKSSATDIDIP